MIGGFRLAPDIYFDNYASGAFGRTKRHKFRRKRRETRIEPAKARGENRFDLGRRSFRPLGGIRMKKIISLTVVLATHARPRRLLAIPAGSRGWRRRRSAARPAPLIGGAASGTAGGALAGGLIGAAAGGIIGANTAPPPPPPPLRRIRCRLLRRSPLRRLVNDHATDLLSLKGGPLSGRPFQFTPRGSRR